MRLAVIENEIVTNIIEGDMQAVKPIFPEGASLVNVDLYPIVIGDSYIGMKFYKDGVEVKKLLTDAEKIANLENTVDELTILLLTQGGAIIG